jgi:phospholipid/cholesterol/gamma-HCH transport system substrate-binding protein
VDPPQPVDVTKGRSSPVKSSEIKEIVVGAAALAVLALVLVVVYGGADKEARAGLATYRLFATFNRIDGLAVGDEVLVSGIQAGRVQSMELDPDFRARVTLRIDRAVQLPIDTAAAIHTDGLFGSKFVVLDPGGDEKMLEDGSVIEFTQDSVIVSELLDLVISEGKSMRNQDEKGKQ